MNEQKVEAALPAAETTTEQARKTWVAPTFERTPLNEAMGGTLVAAHAKDLASGYT